MSPGNPKATSSRTPGDSVVGADPQCRGMADHPNSNASVSVRSAGPARPWEQTSQGADLLPGLPQVND